MALSRFARNLGLALAMALAAAAAQAATFGVAPLRVELGGAGRSAVVTVTNDSAQPLRLSVNAVAWSADENGAEQYQDTNDLAFFPKMLTIPPGEKRVVRVGTELTPDSGEKTYRLFLRELQQDAKPDPRAQVAMLVNFGVPVFLRPASAKPQLAVTATSASPGKLTVNLENTGSASARMEGIRFAGSEPLSFGSAYVLRGNKRVLNLPVTPADCARGAKQALEIELLAGQLKHDVDLTGACR